jgi:hypothetical protein
MYPCILLCEDGVRLLEDWSDRCGRNLDLLGVAKLDEKSSSMQGNSFRTIRML